MVQEFDEASITHGEVKLFGVCVQACPLPGDFVCTYDMQERLQSAYGSNEMVQSRLSSCQLEMNRLSKGLSNRFGLAELSEPCQTYLSSCWVVAQPQTEFVFRCVPEKIDHVEESAKCYYPEFQDSHSNVSMPSTICTDERQFDILPEQCDDAECLRRTGAKCINNERCMFKLTTTTSETVLSGVPGTENVLLTQLTSWTSEITR